MTERAAAASPISDGPLHDWPQALAQRLDAGRAAVLVSVAETRGSTPREVGSKLLVTRDEVLGTVGGGHLELRAVELARERLAGPCATSHWSSALQRFALGPALGQCCGGVAVLLFEVFTGTRPDWLRALCALREQGRSALLVTRCGAVGGWPGGGDGIGAGCGKLLLDGARRHGGLGDSQLEAAALQLEADCASGQAVRLLHRVDATGEARPLLCEAQRPSDFRLQLFGAGHVGRALLQVLAGLPAEIHWLDSREHAFPAPRPIPLAARLRCEWVDEPEWSVDEAPPGSLLLVLTHSHAEDYRIVRRALRRQRARADLAFIGLIGSRSKRRSFVARLRAEGFADAELAALTCPIGVDGISGKQPAEIAIGVAAQLLQLRDSGRAAAGPGQGARGGYREPQLAPVDGRRARR